MPKFIDFRDLPQFIPDAVSRSGQNVGKTIYWKLYAIENFYRVIIHSILSVQIPLDWWLIATDISTRKKSKRF